MYSVDTWTLRELFTGVLIVSGPSTLTTELLAVESEHKGFIWVVLYMRVPS